MNAEPSVRSVGPRLLVPPVSLALLAFAGCAGGSGGDPDNRGDFKVVAISTGTGAVYPYRIRELDPFGTPSARVINIESDETLRRNANGSNGVLPVATLSSVAELPDGSPGNQFLHFRFSHKLNVESILSGRLADEGNSGLSGALSIVAYDPATETSITVKGRGFVNGYTWFNEGGQLRKVQAVTAGGNGVEILDARANGFPSFAGAADLVDRKSFTFVADSDGDLSSFNTFPTGRLLRLVVTNAVLDTEGDVLEQEVATATTVGADGDPPQVLGFSTTPQIAPGNGQTGIDPTTTVLVRFNKPVQPVDVGSFFDARNFSPRDGGLSLAVTAAARTFNVRYHADPVSYGDLTSYIITPSYSLPGDSEIDINIQDTVIRGLTGASLGQPVTTRFRTGRGPGIVNAPVAPEALYVGFGGADPGVSVIDLNGLGQGTGDPDDTRFPLNPNIPIPGLSPPMAPGNSSLDAGSPGVFRLTMDTNGETRLLRSPVVGDVTDIHIGPPLDLVFNNENINVNASRANQINELLGIQMPGNVITQPPVPNPPPLTFPPPNPDRAIFGIEPTTKSSFGAPTALVTGGPPVGCITSPLNLLVQGNPFAGDRSTVGLLGTSFMGVFVGPQPPPGSPPPPPPFCPFTSRQQIGHFLYVLDRDNRQIVVVNSNRFTVLDTIRLSDPVSMAMAPNMTRLAVTNFASASVSFIDIDPTSANFNQVVGETRVENGPTAISWQPDGEDIFVVSTESNSISIISALDFTVRRTVAGFLNRPIEVVVSERYQSTGNLSGVYYAYVLNDNGTVAVYESGPDGVNGIGFNDMVGTVANVAFPRSRKMIYDHASAQGGVLIGHVDDRGLGQVSRLALTATPVLPQPLNPSIGGFVLPPTYRQKEWTVTQRFGGANATVASGQFLSGNSIVDLCTDNLLNVGGALGQSTLFNLAYLRTPYFHSGKHTIKNVTGTPVPALTPRFLFVALSDAGQIDVLEFGTGTRVARIDVPGVRVVADYWRQ
ncbi:MAG: hypothetical protein NXI31_00390 [bacterium]|nr:hypothetical protein [bacterium]